MEDEDEKFYFHMCGEIVEDNTEAKEKEEGYISFMLNREQCSNKDNQNKYDYCNSNYSVIDTICQARPG